MQKKRASAVVRVDDSHVNPAAPKLRSASKNEWGENFIMDRCGLPCVPSLKGRENVQFVSLQHNLIVRIDSLMHFRALMVLNLYDNKIERLSGLDTLKSLRVLMLGKNRIKRIEGLDALLHLDILDLHGNQISVISNLSHLSSLRVLNLAVNSLKKVPSLEGLISLEELNLKRNRICKIAAEIAKARKLERLYLSNNDLRRLDDLNPLTQLGSLKELTLEGNPMTLNANYVMYTVGSLSCLVLLDQNVICPALRHEAEAWSSQNIQQPDLTKIKPVVTVQNKTSVPPVLAPLPPTLGPLTNGKSTLMSASSSSCVSAPTGRHTAIVRPMKASFAPELGLMSLTADHHRGTMSIESEMMPPGLPERPSTGPSGAAGSSSSPATGLLLLDAAGPGRDCAVKERSNKKSFRQIAFSAMVCNATRPSHHRHDRPVFKFFVRPPTVDLSSESDVLLADKQRRIYTSDLDNEDSTSSWTSESDTDTGSSLSHRHSRALTAVANGQSHRKRNSSNAARLSDPQQPHHHHNHHHHHHRSSCHQRSNQKLSASIGVNIKEQLRDLRIIVGEDEIHIDGLNIIRMLNHINWSSEEVDLMRSVVFNGLGFDQLAPYFSTMRLIFPNVRHLVFRNVVLPPTFNHINSLCYLESALWTNWITGLVIVTDSALSPPSPLLMSPALVDADELTGLCDTPTEDSTTRNRDSWISYSIFRFHMFGLHNVNHQTVGPQHIQEAEEQYGALDFLVTLLVPANIINRQIEKLSLLEPQVIGLQASPTARQCTSHDIDLRKRAIRNIHQPLKEAKHFRNRSYYLRDLTEYGMSCVVKLSILSQNWDSIFSEIVERAYCEINDEHRYKKARLFLLRQHQQHQQV